MNRTDRFSRPVLLALLAILIAALLISIVCLLRVNGNLRQQLVITQSSERVQETRVVQQAGTLTAQERERRVKEHLELLSLRGRVAQLARELRERTNASAHNTARPAETNQPEAADSILFTASMTNRIPPDHTLVVGGWKNQGLRGYLLITPRINSNPDAPAGERVGLSTKMIQAPDSFWAEIGWADAKSDTRRSSISGVLTSDQLDALLQALNATEGAQISNESLGKGSDGERIGLGFATADDTESGLLMAVSAFPRIASDQQSIDLEIQPAPAIPNTAVHPSLSQPR